MTTAVIGESVRLICGATGRFVGHGWGLYVCAQDNDLGLDRVSPAKESWDQSPLPSNEAVRAAQAAIEAVLTEFS